MIIHRAVALRIAWSDNLKSSFTDLSQANSKIVESIQTISAIIEELTS